MHGLRHCHVLYRFWLLAVPPKGMDGSRGAVQTVSNGAPETIARGREYGHPFRMYKLHRHSFFWRRGRECRRPRHKSVSTCFLFLRRHMRRRRIGVVLFCSTPARKSTTNRAWSRKSFSRSFLLPRRVMPIVRPRRFFPVLLLLLLVRSIRLFPPSHTVSRVLL